MESIDSQSMRLRDYLGQTGNPETDLQRTRELFQAVFAASGDLIFTVDLDGTVTTLNGAGERLLGVSAAQATGRNMAEFAVEPEVFAQGLREALGQADPPRFEAAFRGAGGAIVLCDVSLRPLTGPDGRTEGVAGLCRDVSARRRLQEDLIRVDRLAEIGRTAAAIAHEINNPLAIINEICGWTALVVDESEDLNTEEKEELRTAFNKITQQTSRCTGITRQLLDFVRKSGPSNEQFDLHEVLNGTLRFLEPELKYKNIDIVRNFPDDALLVRSDSRLLEQVFVNLLSNAIYAIREKGQAKGSIQLTTTEMESGIEVRIEDTGIGIPQEKQERIFDLFYTTKPPGKGTGLGLPICYNIIRKLGGDLTVDSEPNVGTTITVRLPL